MISNGTSYISMIEKRREESMSSVADVLGDINSAGSTDSSLFSLAKGQEES